MPSNSNLDRRLQNRGGNLQLSEIEMTDLENFLLTITKDIYLMKSGLILLQKMDY